MSVALAAGALCPANALAQVRAGGESTSDAAVAHLTVDVVLVRDGELPDGGALDDALVRALREVAGFTNVVFATLPLSELRLAVGCSDDEASCLESVARALDASAIVVRRASSDARGTTLSLVYRDCASQDAPLTVTRTGPPARLGEEMSSLVRSLYGTTEPLAPPPRVRLASWLTLGTGATLLLGGAVLGASASWGEYTTLEAHTPADLERIESSYASARTRALFGNVMLGASMLALGVGGALLALDLLRSDKTPGADRLDLALSPSLHGAMLTLRRSSRNFL